MEFTGITLRSDLCTQSVLQNAVTLQSLSHATCTLQCVCVCVTVHVMEEINTDPLHIGTLVNTTNTS